MLQAAAQALTDRYNLQRPVVVACDKSHPPYSFVDAKGRPAGYYVDVVKAVAEELNVPCRFVMEEWTAAQNTYARGGADLLMGDDSFVGIHFVGRDRQLVEQMEDRYMRMRQNGDIVALEDRWMHPERAHDDGFPVSVCIMTVLLVAAVLLCLLCLFARLRMRRTARRCRDLSKMIGKARQMDKYYADEDTQAAHDLVYRYEAILCTPFVAIAFYDVNGQLIVQNEAMKKLDHTSFFNLRQPLYNAAGKVANYFVIVGKPA